jgi:hypothetical protein
MGISHPTRGSTNHHSRSNPIQAPFEACTVHLETSGEPPKCPLDLAYGAEDNQTDPRMKQCHNLVTYTGRSE